MELTLVCDHLSLPAALAGTRVLGGLDDLKPSQAAMIERTSYYCILVAFCAAHAHTQKTIAIDTHDL